jgi:hypothetical protein
MRYPEAVHVLKDSRFTVDASAIDPTAGVFANVAEGGVEERSFLGAKTMVSVDGTEDARLRARGSSMDVVRDYAYPAPSPSSRRSSGYRGIKRTS